MPANARDTFRIDIARAQALVDHAASLPSGSDPEHLLRDDVLRSGWMFAVGAMDAYFCDAYADVIAATLICKAREPGVVLPAFVLKIQVPVATILEAYTARPNWKWRMAARAMLEEENALQIETIRKWFNPFFDKPAKVFFEVVPAWLAVAPAPDRLFGTTNAVFSALVGKARSDAHTEARDAFHGRLTEMVQRRHDCIHACDRPGNSPQPVAGPGTVGNVIRDITFVVEQFNTHLDTEFRRWLACGGVPGSTGFSNAAIQQVGY
jgi:hypothetical protein